MSIVLVDFLDRLYVVLYTAEEVKLAISAFRFQR